MITDHGASDQSFDLAAGSTAFGGGATSYNAITEARIGEILSVKQSKISEQILPKILDF